MTILVLAIWSFGVAALIAVAVFRGRNRHVIDRSVRQSKSRKSPQDETLDMAIFNAALSSAFPTVDASASRAAGGRKTSHRLYEPLFYAIDLIEDDAFSAVHGYGRRTDLEIAREVSPKKPPTVLTH